MTATARLTRAQRAARNQREVRILLARHQPELSWILTRITTCPCGPGCCLLPHWVRAEPSGSRA